MSAEVQESGGKNGKSKQKKFAVRVDFTPMVDMNMLLITFFMLCTTLSKPQTMEIRLFRGLSECLANRNIIFRLYRFSFSFSRSSYSMTTPCSILFPGTFSYALKYC